MPEEQVVAEETVEAPQAEVQQAEKTVDPIQAAIESWKGADNRTPQEDDIKGEEVEAAPEKEVPQRPQIDREFEDPEEEEEAVEAAPAEEPVAQEAAPAEEPEDKEVAPALVRIAEREKKSRMEHEARKEELRTMEEEFAQKKAAFESADAAVERFRRDPIGFAKDAGVERFDELAQYCWAEAMGEDAPPEWRRAAQANTVQSRLDLQQQEIKELREQLVGREQAVENKRQVESYAADFKPALASIDASEIPTLSHIAKSNPGRLNAFLMEHASAIAVAENRIPTHAEVLASLEEATASELADLGIELGQKKVKEEEEAQPKSEKAPTKTLSSKQTKSTRTKPLASSEEDRVQNAIGVWDPPV